MKMNINMKNKIIHLSLALVTVILTACGGGGGGKAATPVVAPVVAPVVPIVTGDNVIPVTISRGPNNNYMNGLFGSITICKPGTTTCTVVDNVIYDTGSVGVRVLNSALPANFLTPNVDSNGKTINECEAFADGYTWGDVGNATVKLGNLTSQVLPVQIIAQSNFSVPSACSSNGVSENSLQSLGAQGIIGIGLWQNDCGTACSNNTNNNLYYSCDSNGCISTTIPIAQQVGNPVSFLTSYNNGTIISLPPISTTGAKNTVGSIFLGIGNATNNTFSNLNTVNTNNYGLININYKGIDYANSFLDSGSSIYGIIDSSIPQCTGTYAGLFCPNTTQVVNIVASNSNKTQNINSVIYFDNADSLLSTGNNAFYNIGQVVNSSFITGLDLGLSFYFGKTIATGIEGTSSNLGTGSFFAF
jgi:hypothetical protein